MFKTLPTTTTVAPRSAELRECGADAVMNTILATSDHSQLQHAVTPLLHPIVHCCDVFERSSCCIFAFASSQQQRTTSWSFVHQSI